MPSGSKMRSRAKVPKLRPATRSTMVASSMYPVLL